MCYLQKRYPRQKDPERLKLETLYKYAWLMFKMENVLMLIYEEEFMAAERIKEE